MKPSDQLTVLEAFALGYALAGKEQQSKVFALLPASEWVGPLGDLARDMAAGKPLVLSVIGCKDFPLPSSVMKSIMEELVKAETEKRRRSMAEEVSCLAARMNDPRLPGGVPTESEITELLAKARGLYGTAGTTIRAATGGRTEDQDTRTLEKSHPKATGSSQAASPGSSKAGAMANQAGNGQNAQAKQDVHTAKPGTTRQA